MARGDMRNNKKKKKDKNNDHPRDSGETIPVCTGLYEVYFKPRHEKIRHFPQITFTGGYPLYTEIDIRFGDENGPYF